MEFLDLVLSLLALIALEIILGIDNLVFLSILVEKLPKHQRKRARRWGLSLAWITRLILLAAAFFIVHLTKPIISWQNFHFSFRDLFLLVGGAFLIIKATQEIHAEVSLDDQLIEDKSVIAPRFKAIVIQVALMDIVFSIDSVITAIGLTNQFFVMATAITSAILVMLYASEPVGIFIEKHPSIKMLALSFLILIGTVLLADGFGFYVPRGMIYFAMGFSLSVELLNLMKHSRREKRRKL